MSTLVLVLLFKHGAAHAHTTPHHAAAVLHHGLVRRNHPALGKIGNLCGVILESPDDARVGRGLNDDNSLLGHLKGLPLDKFALALALTTGIMAVITPYATGAALPYYNSGYITSPEFWRLGTIFGIIFLAALLCIGVPLLML